MGDKLKVFIELAKDDSELCKRLSGMSVEEVISAAREKGIDLSEEDFKPANGEMSDAELLNAAGGGFCGCVPAGFGTGISDANRDRYWCGCYSFGSGDNAGVDTRNCICIYGGAGFDDGTYTV